MKNDQLSGFNPLRNLDLAGFVAYLERAERGYYRTPMWLYRMVLKRNGVARACRRKLASAIGKLDRKIKIPDDLSPERKSVAENQKQALEQAYEGLRNPRASIVHLALADIFGFAHLEKIYAKTGDDPWKIEELRIVPQWHMRRDGLFGPWLYDAEARDTNTGDPLTPGKWIFREVEDAAAEIFTFAHLKMATTDADWDQFCDTYAVPPIFAELPQGTRREDEPYYHSMVEQIVSDGRGSHPYGGKVYNLQAGKDGVTPFTERLRFYREEIVIAATGGMLTVLDGETGIGKGASDTHDDAWLDIAADIAVSVSEALQLGFDAPLLDRLFPGEEHIAYFELEKPTRDKSPSTVLQDAKTAREAGYEMDAEELSEETGYTLKSSAALSTEISQTGKAIPTKTGPTAPNAREPEPQAVAGDGTLPVESPPAGTAAKIPPSAKGEADESLVQAALANDLEVESRWLAPVAPLLSEIEAMLADPAATIDQIEAKLADAVKSLPDLLPKLSVNELADALEKAAGPAAVQGLAEGLRAKTGKVTV